MGKRKQETLPEMPDINGKLIDTVTLVINIPTELPDVEIRKLDNGDYRIMQGEHSADGNTLETALRGFKRIAKV